MDSNAKKLWPVVATSLVAFTSALSAATDTATTKTTTTTTYNKDGMYYYNTSVNNQLNTSGDLFVTADAFYWQSRSDSSALGYVVTTGSNGTTSNKYIFPRYDWDFGFRVGLGYNLPHDGWDLHANWTWFRNDVKAKETGNITDNDTFGEETLTFKGKMNLNLVDLELGRDFYTGKYLTLRPHFGLRSGWIRQTGDTIHAGLTTLVDNLKNDFWGLGIRAGVDSAWKFGDDFFFGSGWSIAGKASVSFLYGFFDLYFNQGANQPGNTIATSSFRTVKGVTDLSLGLRWDQTFSEERYHLGLQAAWEHHAFFDQNQIPTIVPSANVNGNSGDLTMQGWTLSAKFDF